MRDFPGFKTAQGKVGFSHFEAMQDFPHRSRLTNFGETAALPENRYRRHILHGHRIVPMVIRENPGSIGLNF